MDRLKSLKDCLMAQAQSQMGNLANVDAKELGEVVDMIKDLEEAIYYYTITEAMNAPEHKRDEKYYYMEPKMMYPYGDEWHMYKTNMGRRYYEDGGYPYPVWSESGEDSPEGGHHKSSGRNYYQEYPIELRDHREGRSPKSRRMYMEAKEMHHDKAKQMHELEQYLKELGTDIAEMIEDATPEEKTMLKTKLSNLATRIA